MRAQSKNTTRLLIVASLTLLLVSCELAVEPAPQAPSQQSTGGEVEGLSACDIAANMEGQPVSVTSQIAFVDRGDPEGIFAELADGGCRLGSWINKLIWEGWTAEQQAMIEVGNWLTATGVVVSFQGELLVEISSDAPAAAEAPASQSVEAQDQSEGQADTAPMPDIGDLPSEAMLPVAPLFSGLNDYPALCYLGAFSMLAKYTQPEMDFADVVAYSGLGSSADYWEPPQMDPFVFNRYWERGIILAAQNMEAQIVAGRGSGGFLYDLTVEEGPPLDEQVATILQFENGEQALNHLKNTIANGSPVMVHLDLFFLHDGFASQSDHWGQSVGKDHASHYMVVVGYSEDSLYILDPTDPGQTETPLEAQTDYFLQAWENTTNLENAPPIGPFWILYLSGETQMPEPVEIAAWNAVMGFSSPEALRAFAVNPQTSQFALFAINELAKGRMELATYLERNGFGPAAELYRQSAEMLSAMVIDAEVSADGLNEAADCEEEALALLP